MNPRLIQFIVRMRNETRAGFRALGVDLRTLAQAATVAAQASAQAAAASSALAASQTRLVQQVRRNTAAAHTFTGVLGGLRQQLWQLHTLALGIGTTLGGSFLVEATTLWAKFANRVRAVTEAEQDVVNVREDLFQVSQRAYAPMEGIVGLYSRAAITLRDLGRSDQETLNFVETFSKALTLGGASAQEARSATLQFAQSLGAGALRGEELNAVMEASQRVMRLIAEEMGVGVGQIKALGHEGKITSENLADAMRNGREQIEREFARLVPTFANAGSVLRNALVRAFGTIDEMLGVQRTIAPAIIRFTEVDLPMLQEAVIDFAQRAGPILAGLWDSFADAFGTVGAVSAPVLDFLGRLGVSLGIISEDADEAGRRMEVLARMAGIALAAFVGLSVVVPMLRAISTLIVGVTAFTLSWGGALAALAAAVVGLEALPGILRASQVELSGLGETLKVIVALAASALAGFLTWRAGVVVIGAVVAAVRTMQAAISAALGAWITASAYGFTATTGLTRAFTALNAVIAANPFSFFIGLVTAAATAMFLLRDNSASTTQVLTGLENALSLISTQTQEVAKQAQLAEKETGDLSEKTERLESAERKLVETQNDAVESTQALTRVQRALLAVRKENLIATLRQAVAEAQPAIRALEKELQTNIGFARASPAAEQYLKGRLEELVRLREYAGAAQDGLNDLLSGRRELIPPEQAPGIEIAPSPLGTVTDEAAAKKAQREAEKRQREAQRMFLDRVRNSQEEADYFRELRSTGVQSLLDLASSYAPWAVAQAQASSDLRAMNALVGLAEDDFATYAAVLDRAGITQEQFNYILRRTQDEAQRSLGFLDQVRIAAQRYIEQHGDAFDTLQEAGARVFEGMGDALAEFITTGKLNFKQFVADLLAELAKLAAKQAIISTLSAIVGVPFPVGHTGGITGRSIMGSRRVSPLVFGYAQRRHSGGMAGSGLGYDEVPIIARKDEAIFPTVRLPNGQFGVRAEVERSGGNVFAPNINITLADRGSQETNEDLARRVAEEVTKAMRGIARQEAFSAGRPGGLNNMRP